MNLILFEKHEIGKSISGYDPRAKHIRRTLKYCVGDIFESGIVNGESGKAKIIALDKNEIIIEFTPENVKTTAFPITLIVGLTRPQIAKHIFRESASMGIKNLWFYPAELGEKSYLASNIWKEVNYHTHLVKGAGQGFTTNLPEIIIFKSLSEVVSQIQSKVEKICLDNVKPKNSIANYTFTYQKVALLLGSERGLTDNERNYLESNCFTLLKMGTRVLRTDTACIASIAIVLSKLGLM